MDKNQRIKDLNWRISQTEKDRRKYLEAMHKKGKEPDPFEIEGYDNWLEKLRKLLKEAEEEQCHKTQMI
jgi:hypothetical protein